MSDEKAQLAGRIIEGAGIATVTASAFGQWVSANHDLIWSIGVIGGFFLTAIGLCANLYFGIQRERRERALHALEVKRITRASKAAK